MPHEPDTNDAYPGQDDGGAVSRFYELRYDPDAESRTLTGVAMRYGDIADVGWSRESFEPGAFGEVAGLDVLLDMNHDRGKPLARTGGGGLTLTDGPTELRIEAVLPNTATADEALSLVRSKIYRGFSVRFYPDQWETRNDTDPPTNVIRAATLESVSLVDKPAYPKARVEARNKEPAMDQDEVRKNVEAALSEKTVIDRFAQAVAGVLESRFEDRFTSLADELRSQVEERSEPAPEPEPEPEPEPAESVEDRAQAVAEAAERRAELLALVRPLLPDDAETRGKTDHELLVLAVGEEVSDAESRAAEYLLAKVEDIAERRAAAQTQRTGAASSPAKPASPTTTAATGTNIIRLIERRRRNISARQPA